MPSMKHADREGARDAHLSPRHHRGDRRVVDGLGDENNSGKAAAMNAIIDRAVAAGHPDPGRRYVDARSGGRDRRN